MELPRTDICLGQFCTSEGVFLTDLDYMKTALKLAEKGCGKVDPNPMLGTVIIKDGRIIGKGWHRKHGELYAERNAIADCAESPGDAVLYVTLEPCCHWRKTASVTRKSKWVTGEESCRKVQQVRNRYLAIMTGVGTVLADNPFLTCLRTPPAANVIVTAREVRIVSACNMLRGRCKAAPI